jgi:hypothetical protein
MVTEFTANLSTIELLGLWFAGAVLLNLSLWAAFSLCPWRICLPPAIAGGLCFGLVMAGSFERIF